MNLSQNTKDIISGFVSGWARVFVVQPFEIVKVRLQTQSSHHPYYNGIIDCFKKIAKQEGLLSFYKGTLTPLIGIGFNASTMFFSVQFAKRKLRKYQSNPRQKLQLKYMPLAGLFASFPTALTTCPVEHARIRIQIQKQVMIYHGSVDALVKITRQYGLFSGLYKGFCATLLRQTIGLTTYFTTYQFFDRLFISQGQKQSHILVTLVAGSLAGIAYILVSYPADYIKTLLQTDNFEKKDIKYKGIFDCAYKRYKAAGIQTFFKGLGVVLYRAPLVNATNFFVFESCLRSLGKSYDHH